MSAPLNFPHHSSYIPDSSPPRRPRSHLPRRGHSTRNVVDQAYDATGKSYRHENRHKRHKHHRSTSDRRIHSTTRDRLLLGGARESPLSLHKSEHIPNSKWPSSTVETRQLNKRWDTEEIERRLQSARRKENITMDDVRIRKEERHKQEQ